MYLNDLVSVIPLLLAAILLHCYYLELNKLYDNYMHPNKTQGSSCEQLAGEQWLHHKNKKPLIFLIVLLLFGIAMWLHNREVLARYSLEIQGLTFTG